MRLGGTQRDLLGPFPRADLLAEARRDPHCLEAVAHFQVALSFLALGSDEGQSSKHRRPPLPERPTIRSVAALAGVGKTTVSRVLNGDERVADEIVERVQRAATQLNYHPNRAASDLRRRDGRPSTIGLLIQDVANVFYASIFRAVEDVAMKYGVTVLASNLDEDTRREHQVVSNLISRRVNGLLIVPASFDHSYLHPLQKAGTPVVFLDRAPISLAADSVVSDCEAGSYTAVSRLVALGHRKVGFLGESTKHACAGQRYAGYVTALSESGITVDPEIVRRDTDSEEQATAACMEMLSRPDAPTALFTTHNRLTLGALEAFSALGCLQTRALVGFDDFPLLDRLRPGVSVVAQDPLSMGTIGAEVLFARIRGDNSPMRQRVVPTRLIPRGSGEIAPDQGSPNGQDRSNSITGSGTARSGA